MFPGSSALITLLLWALSPVVTALKLGGHAKDMFDKSMSFLDTLYDESVDYLYWFYYPLAANTRRAHPFGISWVCSSAIRVTMSNARSAFSKM